MTPLETRQVQLERAVRRNAGWTTGLLVLFIVLVVATVAYGYVQAQKILETDRVVDEVDAYIKGHYPEWREDVRKELVKAAPSMAERMRKHARESMPRTRARIEYYLDRQAKVGLGKVQVVAGEDFRKFLQANRADVKKAFADLEKAPAEVTKLTDNLEARLDKQFGVNLRKEAGLVRAWVEQFNAKLERFARNKNLSESDRLERRIVQTLRALEQEGEESAKKVTQQTEK